MSLISKNKVFGLATKPWVQLVCPKCQAKIIPFRGKNPIKMKGDKFKCPKCRKKSDLLLWQTHYDEGIYQVWRVGEALGLFRSSEKLTLKTFLSYEDKECPSLIHPPDEEFIRCYDQGIINDEGDIFFKYKMEYYRAQPLCHNEDRLSHVTYLKKVSKSTFYRWRKRITSKGLRNELLS